MFLALCLIGGLVYAAKNGWLSALEKAITDQLDHLKNSQSND